MTRTRITQPLLETRASSFRKLKPLIWQFTTGKWISLSKITLRVKAARIEIQAGSATYAAALLSLMILVINQSMHNS